MDSADVIYPFVFAYRWGAKANAGADAHEPLLEPTLAAMQERLAGLKIVRVERTKHVIAENWEIFTNSPVVEVSRTTNGRSRRWLRPGARCPGICSS
jgi:hypothetical protein